MKWGFPGRNGSGVIINARAETANGKPMFRNCVLQKRCLIPASGFFEWKETAPKNKEKYMLLPVEENILFFAGIYNIFRNDSGSLYPAFVILTTAANDSVSPIHDRMPYILTGDKKSIWLYDDKLSCRLLSSGCDARLSLKAV
jgi:putative SOS response-associated peptidase YedK